MAINIFTKHIIYATHPQHNKVQFCVRFDYVEKKNPTKISELYESAGEKLNPGLKQCNDEDPNAGHITILY